MARRWWKPHIKPFARNAAARADQRWICEGEGCCGLGSTPSNAFDRWRYQKNLKDANRFGMSKAFWGER
jgi:hypothetical protein